MAELGGITINVGVNISVETVQRCCQILQMYLEDNPDKIVETKWDKGYDRELPNVWISDRMAESEE